MFGQHDAVAKLTKSVDLRETVDSNRHQSDDAASDVMLCCDWTVSEHQKMCEERLAPLLFPSETLSDEDALKLGKKDAEQEVA